MPTVRTLVVGLLLASGLSAQQGIGRAISLPDGTEMRVVPIRHLRADRLEQTLRNFLREDVQARHQAIAGTGSGQRPRPIVITAHEESNSLVVSAQSREIGMVEHLIALLDVPDDRASDTGDARFSVELDGGSVTLTPDAAGGCSFPELVAACQRLTGRTVQFAEDELARQRIRFSAPVRVEEGRFFELFATLLHAHGLRCAVEQVGDAELVKILPLAASPHQQGVPGAGYPLATPEAIERDAFVRGSHVAVAVDVGHVDATSLAKSLFTLAGGSISSGGDLVFAPLGDGDELLVAGFAPRVRESIALIRQLDRPSRDSLRSAVAVLEHADASALAATLVSLFGSEYEDANASRFRAHAVGPRRVAIAGPHEVVEQALALVAELDVAVQDR